MTGVGAAYDGWQVALLFVASAAAGCGSSRGAPPANELRDAASIGDGGAIDARYAGDGPDAGTVAGVVVDMVTGRPLAHRIVTIGSQMATTDVGGRFELGGVRPTYSPIVTDADGTSMTVYLGVSRRDPVLSHTPSNMPDPLPEVATVGGMLSGATFPLPSTDVVAVYFFSDEADGNEFLGGALPAILAGPSYGPLQIAWSGASSVAGQLVAVGTFAGPSAASASQTLSLDAGSSPTVSLSLQPVPDVIVSGQIQAQPPIAITQTLIEYHLNYRHAIVGVVNEESASPAFSFPIPDLSALGGKLCAGAVGSPGFVESLRCGFSPAGSGVALTLQTAPSLMVDVDGGPITPTTPLAWTKFENGVYELQLGSGNPSASTPSIEVFTAATSTTLSEIDPTAFPANTTYRCAVGGLGPFASIDDLVGPAGLSAPSPAELRRSFSDPVRIQTSP